MSADSHDHLLRANRELQEFLKRAEGLVQGRGEIVGDDLRSIGRLLEATTPELGELSRQLANNAEMQALIQEYTSNLRCLQTSLEQIRCVMLARRAQLDAERRRLNRLHGWADAYRRTT